jgi:hypothetical protein
MAMHSKLGDWSPHTHIARDDRNPDTLISVGRHTRKGDCTAVSDSRAIGTLSPCDTLISFKRHTRKGSGSVATTPSTTRLSKRCVHSSAIIGTHSRLRRKSDRNPVTLISFKRHTRKRPLLARLRQRQVQRGSRSDACTARPASEPSDTCTHLLQASHSQGLWLGCDNEKLARSSTRRC